MLKSKRVLAGILSLLVAGAALGGCQKEETAEPQSGAASQSGTSSQTAGEEKPDLKALVGYHSGMDYNTYPVSKYLEEKTGYHVTYDTLPADKPDDKLNAIMASGADYDFIIYRNKQLYANYAQQGALTDLEPLVEKYGPNITKNISKESFDNFRIGGKYYMIPSMNVNLLKGKETTGKTTISNSVIIRQDILEKLGASIPKTIDEFTALLQRIKDEDPNQQGAKNIPLVAGNSFGTDFMGMGLGGAFGIATSWVDQNGKLVPREELPGFKEYIRYLKELYSKGLLDKEAPANAANTTKEKFTSGRAFAFIDGWWDFPALLDAFKKTQPGAEITFLPALSGKLGKAAFGTSSYENAIDTFLMIPHSSQHAEDVIKYVNLKLDEEIFKGMVLGEEGADYTVKDGAYYPILPAFMNDRGNANEYTTGVTKSYSIYWQARVHKDENLFKAFHQLNGDYMDMLVVDPISRLPIEISAQLAQEQTVVNDLTNQFIVQSVTGDFSDETYQAFLEQWKSQGGDDIIKKVNDWYATAKK